MKITAVLLAAGQGTRMKSDVPKVLHPLCGKPMLWHVLEALKSAATETPVPNPRRLFAHEGILLDRG